MHCSGTEINLIEIILDIVIFQWLERLFPKCLIFKYSVY